MLILYFFTDALKTLYPNADNNQIRLSALIEALRLAKQRVRDRTNRRNQQQSKDQQQGEGRQLNERQEEVDPNVNS